MGQNNITNREAFAIVRKNCGLDQRSTRVVLAQKGIEGKIRSLARTSPDYQRHVIQRLLAGDRNPFRLIATSLDVYDTISFNEVLSRLHRARGLLKTNVRGSSEQEGSSLCSERAPQKILTLHLIVEQATYLEGLLRDLVAVGGQSTRMPSKPSVGDRVDHEGFDSVAAPAALGLIAKNVRNVSKLQESHLPIEGEKQKALELTQSIRQMANSYLIAARSKFGRADEECRVRPRSRPKRRIITHERPDGDAIASAWLAERFHFRDEPVELLFLPRGRVLGAYRSGDCLVDVGNAFDPQRHYFDHKPPAFADRFESCAAKLVWNHLLSNGVDVEHLQKLVNAVHAVDAPKQQPRYFKEHQWSVTDGFQAAIEKARQKCDHDADLYRSMRRWLDRHSRESHIVKNMKESD